MKLNDLKTGMVVQTRERGLYLVLRDTCFDSVFQDVKDVLWHDGGNWMPLSGYSEDMKRIPDNEEDELFCLKLSEEERKQSAANYDITAVIMPYHPASLDMDRLDGMPDVKLLWTEKDGDLENMTIWWYNMMKRQREYEEEKKNAP